MTEDDILELDQSAPSTIDFLYEYICSQKAEPSLIRKLVLERGLDVNLDISECLSLFELVCTKFDLETVKFCVEHGADLTRNDGRLAIVRPCVENKVDTVQYLIDQGVKLDYPGDVSPLMATCCYGCLDTAKILLENGAKLDDVDDHGKTALFWAAQYGHLDLVKLLLSASANREIQNESDLYVNSVNSLGASALLVSVHEGYLDIAKYLIENGADLKVVDFAGLGLMHMASKNGHEDLVEYLLQIGASACDLNLEGESPLHLACGAGHFEIVKLLVESGGVDLNTKTEDKQTPLMHACTTGQHGIVQYLLEKGADISCIDAFGHSCLEKARYSGNAETVKLLLDFANRSDPKISFADLLKVSLEACENGDLEVLKNLVQIGGVDINAIEKSESDSNVRGSKLNLVQTAVVNGNADILEYLLDFGGVNLEVVDGVGNTLLHLAALLGYLDIVKLIVEKAGFDAIDRKNSDEGTPFNFACGKGHLDVAQYLLEKGADINEIDSYGCTSLHTSAAMGQLEVVKFLLSKGVDINPVSKSNATPLDMAIDRDRHAITTHLRELGGISLDERRKNDQQQSVQTKELKFTMNLNSAAGVDSFMYMTKYKMDPEKNKNIAIFIATLSGDLDQLKEIFEHPNSYDANTTDEDGITPIFWACKHGYMHIVKYLFEKGADIEHQNNYGSNPIRYACANGQLEVVKYAFEDLGIDDKSITPTGWTYLHFACQADQVDLIKYLIQRGADITAKDNNGATPIHIASGKESINVVRYILETYSSVCGVNDKDARGQTAIVYAVSKSDLQITKYLVEQGADVNVKFGSNFTVLHHCALNKFNELGKFLISSGADIHATLTNGYSPFTMAAVKDNLELVRYFLSIEPLSVLSCGMLTDILIDITKEGNLEMLKILAEHGADLTAVKTADFPHLSLIHLAVIKEHLALVEYLLENKYSKFNVDMLDDRNITALMFASFVGNLPIAKLLIEHGANKYLRDIEYKTASQVAKENNHPHIVRYLDGGGKTKTCFFCF